MRLTGRRPVATGVLAALLGAAAGHATTVVPMSLATLADHAGQVLLGEVVAVRSYWADNPRRIETEVRLTGVEYLKGALPDSRPEFTLIVPGGTVGTVTARIGCAPEFALGDRWLLFLLPEYRVFPTVGVGQGAFRIRSDPDGTPRVFTADGDAVVTIDDNDFPHTARICGGTSAETRLVARRGLRVRVRTSANPPPALTLDDFRARLAPVLAASRDHGLTQPAGRPVHVQWQARPLRAAPEATAPHAALRGLGAAVEMPGPAERSRSEEEP